MEARIARIESDVDYIEATLTSQTKAIDELRGDMKDVNKSIGATEGKIAGVDAKIDGKFAVIEARMTSIEGRMSGVEGKIGKVETRIWGIENKIENRRH